MDNRKILAIAILIGGKSLRFGTEKPVISFFDKPLILHQIETLAAFDEDVFLVAHSTAQIINYKKKIDFPKEIRFIVDDREFFPYENLFSPTLGVYSALKELDHLEFEKVLIISGDAPMIKAEVIEHIIKQSIAYDCCVPKWENGYLESLFAVYPVKSALSLAEKALKANKFNLSLLIDPNWKINYISVERDLRPLDKHLLSLFNISGPIDIEKLIKYYEKKE